MNTTPRTRPQTWSVLFILLLALGGLLRLIDLTDPPLDFHTSRQLRNSLVAREIYYNALPSATEEQRQLATSFANSVGKYEPPVIETIVGYSYFLTGGENIAAGYRTPEQAHKSWMDSGGHRKNIRNENYRYMGVGAYYLPGSEYGWYWVQVFATYREDPMTHDWIDPGQGDPVITREQILQMQGQNPKQPASRATSADNTRQVPKQPVRRRG